MIRPHSINVHILPCDFVHQSRTLRITAALESSGYFDQVWMLGITAPGLAEHEPLSEHRAIWRFTRPIPFGRAPLWKKTYAALVWYAKIWRFLRSKNVGCINCHSLPMLPLCVLLKMRHRALLVYDTHELETETPEDTGIRRPLVKLTERLLIRFADHIFCVSPSIAEWYRAQYGVALPTVILNIPDQANAATPSISLRHHFGLDTQAILFLYLGVLVPHRGIEPLLQLFAGLPSHYHFIAMGDGVLAASIQHAAVTAPNIHHMPAVAPSEVVGVARGADVGVFISDHACLSHEYALPNKIFEYLHAGLPVLVSDFVEMRRMVDTHGIGWLLPETASESARLIRQFDRATIDAKRANVAQTAAVYRWEIERARLLAVYAALCPNV